MWCFWGTEKCPRWWQQGRRWSPRVRSGPSWAGTWPHVSLAQWPKQIKTKTNILSFLPTTGVERRLPHCTVSESWWRPCASCLGGSLPRPLHLSPPLYPHQPLDWGLMYSLHLQALLHWSLGYSWLWRNCCETEFLSAWYPVCSMSVCFCCAGRDVWYSVFLLVDWALNTWEGSRQQSLNTSELVHNWTSASVSLLNIPVTCWGWSSAQKLQYPLFTECLRQRQCGGWCKR